MAAKKPSRRRTGLPIAAGLALLTVAVYWQTLDNGFAYFDDDGYVVDNLAVRQGLTWDSLAFAWTTFLLGNWIPLTWMSYELDATLWGIRAPAFHATDLALQVTNVLLLFFLAKQISGKTGCSAILAALWGVHPLHVESVAWIAERKDVLSTFFLLLSLFLYERYAARMRPGWYAGMYCAFLMGMLSKPMLVTLPILLLLFDYWPLQRWKRSNADLAPGKYPAQPAGKLIFEKLPLLIASAAFAGVMVWAQHSQSFVAPVASHPLLLRIANLIESYGWYVGKTFAPIDLCPFYPLWLRAIEWPRFIGATVLIACVSAWVVAGHRRRPWLAFGWLWFLISLLPVIGIVQLGGAAHADRYSYIPHLGLIALFVWEADYWLSRLPRGVALKVLLSGVLLAFYSELTILQVGYWHDPESLWKHALEIDKDNWMAHLHLGRDSLRENDTDTALEHFQATIELNPGYTDAYLFLGAMHQHQKQWDEAERFYQQALNVEPDNFVALMNLGAICRQTGRLSSARDYLLRSLAVEPTATRPRDELKLVEKQELDKQKQQIPKGPVVP